MSARFMKLPPRGRSESGRPLCRWCKTEIPAGSRRTSWCSRVCSEEYLIRSSGSYARRKVLGRDGGVCALCGLDTGRVTRILKLLRARARTDRSWAEQWSHEKPFTSAATDRARWMRAVAWLTERGYHMPGPWHLPHLWEADHVVPVAEGGGATGLENLRTLCRKCHARESGLLRRRLNAAKRPQLSLPEAK